MTKLLTLTMRRISALESISEMKVTEVEGKIGNYPEGFDGLEWTTIPNSKLNFKDSFFKYSIQIEAK